MGVHMEFYLLIFDIAFVLNTLSILTLSGSVYFFLVCICVELSCRLHVSGTGIAYIIITLLVKLEILKIQLLLGLIIPH